MAVSIQTSTKLDRLLCSNCLLARGVTNGDWVVLYVHLRRMNLAFCQIFFDGAILEGLLEVVNEGFDIVVHVLLIQVE